MITFFRADNQHIYAVQSKEPLAEPDIEKLVWLFDGAKPLSDKELKGHFVGPRREMVTPWSTNAVEITQNMGIEGIVRVEKFMNYNDWPLTIYLKISNLNIWNNQITK